MSGPEDPNTQVDFTNIRYAPVMNIVVQNTEGDILIVQRSNDVGFYPGSWNGIGGFLDDDQDFEEKVTAELHEETGITNDQIRSVELGPIFHDDAPEYNKTWIIHPVRVRITGDIGDTDWEADQAQWIAPDEIGQYQVIPSFLTVLEKLGLRTA
jgi:8-oxo-dGTP pyrophosphatase MutT (NUDIX family)